MAEKKITSLHWLTFIIGSTIATAAIGGGLQVLNELNREDIDSITEPGQMPSGAIPIEGQPCMAPGLTKESPEVRSGSYTKYNLNGKPIFIQEEGCLYQGKPFGQEISVPEAFPQDKQINVSPKQDAPDKKSTVPQNGNIFTAPEVESSDCSCTSKAGTFRYCNAPEPGDEYMCKPGNNWVRINP